MLDQLDSRIHFVSVMCSIILMSNSRNFKFTWGCYLEWLICRDLISIGRIVEFCFSNLILSPLLCRSFTFAMSVFFICHGWYTCDDLDFDHTAFAQNVQFTNANSSIGRLHYAVCSNAAWYIECLHGGRCSWANYSWANPDWTNLTVIHSGSLLDSANLIYALSLSLSIRFMASD